jgi:hypothetical protein
MAKEEALDLSVGGHLPRRLTAKHMMQIFEVKQARFYQLTAQGKFDRFELRPRVGRMAWSGALVEKYLDCEAGSSRFVTTSKPLRVV